MHQGRYVHQVPQVEDSTELRAALHQISLALQADKALFPEGSDKAFFMIGVLEAEIAGREVCFAAGGGSTYPATTGGWLERRHLSKVAYRKGKWEVCHPAKPRRRDRWKTIAGHRTTLPADVHRSIRTCPAIGLLTQVGESNPEHEPISRLRMSEMVFIGKDVPLDDPDIRFAARRWQGNRTASSWTAHSCEPCSAGIPYLICTVAPNEFDSE